MKRMVTVLVTTLFLSVCTAQAADPTASGAALMKGLPWYGKAFYLAPPVVFMGIIPLTLKSTHERYAKVDCNTVTKEEGRGICSHIGPTNCYAGDNWYSDACKHFR